MIKLKTDTWFSKKLYMSALIEYLLINRLLYKDEGVCLILRDALKWVDRRLSNRLLGHSIGLYPEIKGMRGRNSLKKSDSRIAQNIYHSGVCSVEKALSIFPCPWIIICS